MLNGVFEAAQAQCLEGLLRALNFGIEGDELLHQRFRALAGKQLSVRFDVPGPFNGRAFHWKLAADGLLEDCSTQTVSAPDVCLAITPEFFSAALDQALFSKPGEQQAAVMRGIRIEGDASVAEQLGPLVALLRQRLSPLQQALAQSPLASLAQQAAHYAAHEGGLLVNRSELLAHQHELRQLRDAIDRLEKRIDRRAAESAGSSSV